MMFLVSSFHTIFFSRTRKHTHTRKKKIIQKIYINKCRNCFNVYLNMLIFYKSIFCISLQQSNRYCSFSDRINLFQHWICYSFFFFEENNRNPQSANTSEMKRRLHQYTIRCSSFHFQTIFILDPYCNLFLSFWHLFFFVSVLVE